LVKDLKTLTKKHPSPVVNPANQYGFRFSGNSTKGL